MSQIFRLCCHEIWKTICSHVVNRSTWSPTKKQSVNLRNNSANISVQLTYFRLSRMNFQSKSYVFSTYAVCTHTCMPALSVRYHWCYIRMLISSKVLCKLPQFSRLLTCQKIILAEWFSSNQLEQVEWKQLKHVAHILAWREMNHISRGCVLNIVIFLSHRHPYGNELCDATKSVS